MSTRGRLTRLIDLAGWFAAGIVYFGTIGPMCCVLSLIIGGRRAGRDTLYALHRDWWVWTGWTS